MEKRQGLCIMIAVIFIYRVNGASNSNQQSLKVLDFKQIYIKLQSLNQSLVAVSHENNPNFSVLSLPISTWNDCASLYNDGYTESGVYSIWLTTGYRFLPIYCDMETRHPDTNKRGWMVIQRRYNGEVDFNRTWQEYVNGFGSPHGEYWIGLENIYQLASFTKKLFDERSLLLELTDQIGTHVQVAYEAFEIQNSTLNYMLARPVMTSTKSSLEDGFLGSHWSNFSTYDLNNQDANHFGNCAQISGGGWWLDFTCGSTNLNARYPKKQEKMTKSTMFWENWNRINPNNDALNNVSMKIQ